MAVEIVLYLLLFASVMAAICFMNAVSDVREDKKWDREIRKEKESGRYQN